MLSLEWSKRVLKYKGNGYNIAFNLFLPCGVSPSAVLLARSIPNQTEIAKQKCDLDVNQKTPELK